MYSKQLTKFFLVSLVLVSIVSCKPRGETITLDQSLDIARSRFATAMLTSKDKLPADLTPNLDSLKANIERLASVSSLSGYQQETKGIAEGLKPLILKSGYATRVALDEIYKQHLVASDPSSQVDFQKGTAKLLAQRTYHVLSAELENARFSL